MNTDPRFVRIGAVAKAVVWRPFEKGPASPVGDLGNICGVCVSASVVVSVSVSVSVWVYVCVWVWVGELWTSQLVRCAFRRPHNPPLWPLSAAMPGIRQAPPQGQVATAFSLNESVLSKEARDQFWAILVSSRAISDNCGWLRPIWGDLDKLWGDVSKFRAKVAIFSAIPT